MYNETNALAALMHLDKPETMQFYLGLRTRGLWVAFLFWGLWLIPLAYMIYHSPLFPRIMGVLVFLAGLGYTLGFVLRILLAEPEAYLAVLEYLTFGELIWMLWFTIRGARFSHLSSLS
jgi:hypothetical protein